MKIVYSKRATAALFAISAYLKPLSPQGAKHVRNAIRATLSQLTKFPRLANLQATPGVHKIITAKYPYLIYYTIDDTAGTISVVTIRHASQRREFEDV